MVCSCIWIIVFVVQICSCRLLFNCSNFVVLHVNVELPHNIDYEKSLHHFDYPQYMLLCHQFFHKLDICLYHVAEVLQQSLSWGVNYYFGQ